MIDYIRREWKEGGALCTVLERVEGKSYDHDSSEWDRFVSGFMKASQLSREAEDLNISQPGPLYKEFEKNYSKIVGRS